MKENISGNNYEKVAHKALYVLLQRSVFSDSCCPLIGQGELVEIKFQENNFNPLISPLLAIKKKFFI